MALYKVLEDGETEPKRLLKAENTAAGFRHLARNRFVLVAVTDPAEAAELGSKLKLEIAGETGQSDPPALPDAAGILGAVNLIGDGREVGEEMSATDLFDRLVADSTLPDTAEARAAFVEAVKAGLADESMMWTPTGKIDDVKKAKK